MSWQTHAAHGARRVTDESRFLHIVPDNKFIDDARGLFEEVLPGAHDYVVLAPKRDTRLIKTFEPLRIDSAAERRRLLRELPAYRAVLVHFLHDTARLFLDRAPASTRLVWIGWGADYYHLIRNRDELILPGTRELLDAIKSRETPHSGKRALAGSLLPSLRRPVHALRRRIDARRIDRIGPGRQGEMRFLNRFELFAPVLREEFDAIRSARPDFAPEFAEWNYWSSGLEALDDDLAPAGRNILLGNSATPENNHVDAMRLIAPDSLGARRILCPLSYGDDAYGDLVSAAGARAFGAGFVPMRSYLDAAAYLETLRSCSIAAMNHVRQQGLGNIIMMLWFGARVFLNPASPVNRELASLGIDVFHMEELPGHLALPDPPVDPGKLLETRERLRHRFGRDAILGMTRQLLARAGEIARDPEFKVGDTWAS